MSFIDHNHCSKKPILENFEWNRLYVYSGFYLPFCFCYKLSYTFYYRKLGELVGKMTRLVKARFGRYHSYLLIVKNTLLKF